MKPKLILASTSPYRKELLQRLKLPFAALAPRADETAKKAEFLGKFPQLNLELARTLAAELAALKATSLVTEGEIIVGSDQICFHDGVILGKPGTPEKAFATLRKLAGRAHHLLTAVTVLSARKTSTWVHSSSLTLRPLTDEEIHAYLAKDEPWDCAGSYKLEAAGIALMSAIDSDDWTGIQGLPLLTLTKVLREHGMTV